MAYYIIKRLLLMIPTLLGMLLMTFAIIQFAPGGPVEQIVARLQGHAAQNGGLGGSGNDMAAGAQTQVMDAGGAYRGAQGIDPALIEKLRKQYGLDRPAPERFFKMVYNFFTLDFGESFYGKGPVLQLILDKLPVSMTLGLWTLMLSYCISIPLGIRKAVHDGTRFDVWTSSAVIVGYAIPGFLFAVLMIILFAGGNYWNIFPRKGLGSDNWNELSMIGKVLDYLWHIALPITAMALGGFATTTFLTKNSFLDEIKKQYVVTARAKGLNEFQVLYGHVFRNAMLIVIAGFPAAFFGSLVEGALLIERTFSLNGMGQMGFEALRSRDYPIIFASLFIFGCIGLLLNLLSDLIYTAVDPRIDFESREV
jgi:microcin C transport system permease protein